MKRIATALLLTAIYSPIFAAAGGGYKITGQSGIMFFVAVDAAQRAGPGNSDGLISGSLAL